MRWLQAPATLQAVAWVLITMGLFAGPLVILVETLLLQVIVQVHVEAWKQLAAKQREQLLTQRGHMWVTGWVRTRCHRSTAMLVRVPEAMTSKRRRPIMVGGSESAVLGF